MAVNGRQCFLLALLAMVVNALWVWRAMVVNGFATAWLWELSLMACFARCGWVRGCSSYAGICASRGFLRLRAGFSTLMAANGH